MLQSCQQPDGIWHADNVTLTCTYTDGGSGPASQTIDLMTSVPTGSEDANASATVITPACDAVGNCAPLPNPISGNKIDRKAPVITITMPSDGGVYLLNQQLASSYGCTDGGSGLASCVGSVANGSDIDTGSVGTKSFTVNATDNVGNTDSKTATYQVEYASAGRRCDSRPGHGHGAEDGAVGHTILAPIKADGSGIFKAGRVVPARFRVCDANGVTIGTNGVVSSFRLTSITTNGITQTVDQPVSSATPDDYFRYDPRGRLWIFDIDTKSLAAGSTYTFTIALNDGTSIVFSFTLR